MSRISEYMDDMFKIYGDKVELTKSTYDENTLSLVAKALREFYAFFLMIQEQAFR